MGTDPVGAGKHVHHTAGRCNLWKAEQNKTVIDTRPNTASLCVCVCVCVFVCVHMEYMEYLPTPIFGG